MEIVTVTLGVCLFPVSYHSFVTKSISRLFFAKAKENYFGHKESEGKKQEGFDPCDLAIIRQNE